jgi:hypothetical protein
LVLIGRPSQQSWVLFLWCAWCCLSFVVVVVVRPVWWRATIVAQVATVGALFPDISFWAGMQATNSPKLLG